MGEVSRGPGSSGAEDLLSPTERGVPRALRLLQKTLSDPRSKDVVEMADALFVQRDLPLVPTFMLRFQRIFHQMVKQVDFSETARARDIVNAWVKQHTNGEQQQQGELLGQASGGPGSYRKDPRETGQTLSGSPGWKSRAGCLIRARTCA